MNEFFPKLRRRKEYRGKPGVSGHRRFRAEIAEDCLRRCVYCDCAEDDIGGDPMMELDHFRPEALFAHLCDEPTNLVYACRSCNGKKRHDWPAGEGTMTHVNGAGYLDPFTDERQMYFRVAASGEVQPLNPPAAYLVSRLALNRPLLQMLRRRSILRACLKPKIEAAIALLEERIEHSPHAASWLIQVRDVLRAQQELEQNP